MKPRPCNYNGFHSFKRNAISRHSIRSRDGKSLHVSTGECYDENNNLCFYTYVFGKVYYFRNSKKAFDLYEKETWKLVKRFDRKNYDYYQKNPIK